MSDHVLISLEDAAAAGIELVRKPFWKAPLDHVKIDIVDGRPGPWAHVYSPMNRSMSGRDPVDVLTLGKIEGRLSCDPAERCFVRYEGAASDSDEYRAAADAFEAYANRVTAGAE